MNKMSFCLLATNSKLLLVLLITSFVYLQSYAQDLVIMRDGTIKQVRIVQTSLDRTLVIEGNGRHTNEAYLENHDIYMLKFRTRGNVVFNEHGERILSTSQSQKFAKDASVVYYRDGREVEAYNLRMDQHVVYYETDKKGRGQSVSEPRSDIFMVCYPDGTRDILVDLQNSNWLWRQPLTETPPVSVPVQQPETEDKEEETSDTPTTNQRVTIITRTGGKLHVWLVSEGKQMISYKKENSAKAPVFKMSRSRIKAIKRN